MKNSVKIAVCGISTALSVVLLFLGGVMPLFIYIMPMASSFIMIMLRKTFGVSDAMITYVATSLLSFILVPNRECMLMYVMFFGFYPILFPRLAKIKNGFLRGFVKFLIFNIMVALVQLVLIYVFGIPFTEENTGVILIVIFVLSMYLLFVIYDIVVKLMYIVYERKLEKKIKKYFK